MYTLFWAPGTAAMAPHAVLEEIGAPHKLVKVDLKSGEHRKPEYLKLNPKGRVPVLIEGDSTLTESAAIVMHLADRHPEAKLAPAPGTPERARYYQWLLYLTNTVQPAIIDYFHPDWTFEDAAQQAALKASAEKRLGAMFDYIDAELAQGGGPYLLGGTFCACDLFLAMLTRWTRYFARPGYQRANVKRLTDLVKERPAMQRMMAAQGIEHIEKA
jgi:glutathione S-transferase